MRRRRFLSAASAVGVGALAGCNAPAGGGTETAGEGATTDTTTEGAAPAEEGTTAGAGETTTAAAGRTEVRMVTQDGEYFFDPIGLFVEPGTTVEWVNESGAHSSTAYAESLDAADVTRIPNDAEPWDSGILTEQGASFSYTFDVQGTYDYFCIPHKALGMVARIVCGEPGDVDGDPPDGDVPAEQAIVEQGAISYEEFAGGG